jgi:acetyl-CoA acetyltransferase
MAMNKAAIVGYAETKIVERSEPDIWELGADVLAALLRESGLEKGEIDGLVLSNSMTGAGDPFWSQHTAEHLGLELGFCETVGLGGCSPIAAVARACLAVEAGLATNVLCLYADKAVSENNWRWRAPHDLTDLVGYLGPPAAFGMLSNRYAHQYGLDYRMLAKLAVTQREHAILNPLACEKLRKPISADDYLRSRMIADPIRLLDCVMLCEGASGLLVTSRKNAEKRGFSRFVVPTGYGEITNYRGTENVVDIAETGHGPASRRAFAEAGITPADIQSIHFYDDFIFALLLQLEMLGFCAPGQACDFIREHDFGHLGDLPLNTSGGQISAGQPGLAGGGVNLIEAVRQLMGGGGDRQIPHARNAVVTGIGGIPYGRNWTSSVVMVLNADG